MQTVDRRALVHGALAALVVIAPLTVLRAIVDHNVARFDSSGWAPLFALGLLGAYVLGGWVAGREAHDAPLTNGILAGIGALVAWLVVRVAIWAVREPEKALFGGTHSVFTVGNLFGAVLFAALFGLVGAMIGARMANGGESAGRPRTGLHPSEERPDSAGQGAG